MRGGLYFFPELQIPFNKGEEILFVIKEDQGRLIFQRISMYIILLCTLHKHLAVLKCVSTRINEDKVVVEGFGI